VNDGLGWALEHYVIVGPIASGRFGSVFHARHAATGQAVALKLIPRQGPESDEKVAAERHGAILQQHFSLAHTNLVPDVFEHGPMGGFYAIAMEFVAGQQLSELVKSGLLPPRRAAEIGLAICTFLEKAHQFKTTIEEVHYELIVHADLKPDHILILPDDTIRVLDFGIAKALETRSLVTTNKWGSVQYASPERLQSDGRVNRHTDFWSLGVMLFEMLAGYRPYRRFEYSVSRLDRAIRTMETPEGLPPGSDPVLGAIVRKLLATQIERRYASAAAIAKDLEAYTRGELVTAALEEARAGQETIRVAPAARDSGIRDQGSGIGTRPTAATRGAPSPTGVRDGFFQPVSMRRIGRVSLISTLVIIGLLEGAGLVRGAQARARVGAFEPTDVRAARSAYQAVGRWTPLGLGSRSVAGALTTRMVDLADRAILDYRTELPTVNEVQWQRALECLGLARELAPGDRRVAAKHAYVSAHLQRINAKTKEDVDRAIRLFRESARLDSRSPDPYLGLARVAAYVTQDPEALRQAILEAQSRGYVPGRRERAQSGDLHKVLADRARADAARLNGASRLEQLQRAAAEYQGCIESFNELHYFNSDLNLTSCRRRLEQVEAEIERARPAPPDAGLVLQPAG
jgi:hypothetical protein